MASKFLFALLLLLSSQATQISSQGLANLISGADSMSSCVQKLIPCQAYLTGSSMPPDSCCGPLKGLVTGDSQCLCQLFNNPDMLKSLAITQAGALALAKTCGTDTDVLDCNEGAAKATPADSQATPADSSTLSNATLTATAPESPAKSGATSHLAGSGVVALCFALIISKLW